MLKGQIGIRRVAYKRISYTSLKLELERQGYQRNGRDFRIIDERRIPCHVYCRDIANTLKITVFITPHIGIVDGRTEWNKKRLIQVLKAIRDYNVKYQKRAKAEESLPADTQMERVKVGDRTFIDYPGLPPRPSLSADTKSLLANLSVPIPFTSGEAPFMFGLQQKETSIHDLNPLAFFSTALVMPGLDEANKSLSSSLLRLAKQVSCQYLYLPKAGGGRPAGVHRRTLELHRWVKRLYAQFTAEDKRLRVHSKSHQRIQRVADMVQKSFSTVKDILHRKPVVQ